MCSTMSQRCRAARLRHPLSLRSPITDMKRMPKAKPDDIFGIFQKKVKICPSSARTDSPALKQAICEFGKVKCPQITSCPVCDDDARCEWERDSIFLLHLNTAGGDCWCTSRAGGSWAAGGDHSRWAGTSDHHQKLGPCHAPIPARSAPRSVCAARTMSGRG